MYSFEMFNTNSGWIMKDGVQVCILRKSEVNAWIFRAEKADQEEIEYQLDMKAARIMLAREYIASRALRPAQPVQIQLF